MVLISYLANNPARYALLILSTVDYLVVGTGYLCLAQ